MLAYPLQWPPNWQRAARRQRATFRVTLAQARDDLYDELERLGATSVTISSNATLNLNGTISARQSFVADPGVAVYFTRKGQDLSIACDKWDDIGDNIRAIGLTVAAFRGLERWGSSQFVDAAFTGYAALPAQTAGGSCWDVLGIAPDADRKHIEAAYRNLARVHHPDAAGNEHMFKLVTEAYQQALASLRDAP